VELPRSGTRRATLLAAVVVGVLLLTGCTGGTTVTGPTSSADRSPGPAAHRWSFKDATGTTIELDHRPERIVVVDDLAVSFLQYGVRPVGTFGTVPLSEDARFDDLVTSGITEVGTDAGDVDLTRLAGLEPDLVVTTVYPTDGSVGTDDLGTGFVSRTRQDQIGKIAPVLRVEWGGKGIDAVRQVTRLAEALGAPRTTVDTAERAFDAARSALSDAADGRHLRVVSMYADADGVYVTRPADEPTLQLYDSLGVDLVDPGPDGFYWGVYSWANAGRVTGDVLLLSPEGYQTRELLAQPTFADAPALVAGQVHSWPVPGLDYASQATAMTELAGWLEDSRTVSRR
jgi:iron complex transport system substrate-binding protein